MINSSITHCLLLTFKIILLHIFDFRQFQDLTKTSLVSVPRPLRGSERQERSAICRTTEIWDTSISIILVIILISINYIKFIPEWVVSLRQVDRKVLLAYERTVDSTLKISKLDFANNWAFRTIETLLSFRRWARIVLHLGYCATAFANSKWRENFFSRPETTLSPGIVTQVDSIRPNAPSEQKIFEVTKIKSSERFISSKAFYFDLRRQIRISSKPREQEEEKCSSLSSPTSSRSSQPSPERSSRFFPPSGPPSSLTSADTFTSG